MPIRGADLVVRHLEAQGVRHVFGVPGASSARPPEHRAAPASPGTPHAWHSSTELHH